MFQTLLKLTLIPITIHPDMHSITLSFTHPPLSNIAISFTTLPHSRTMFKPIKPFTLIKLSVWPTVLPNSFWFAIYIYALIDCTICKLFIALALLEIVLPITFIKSLIIIEHDALSMSLAVHYLTKINRFSELFEFEVLGSSKFLDIEHGRSRLVLFELFVECFERCVTDD